MKNISQLLLIVFSVVLGIFLSERIEERKDKNEAVKLLSKITAEVNENKKLLEYWAPYHSDMARGLDSLSNNEIFIENFIQDKSVLFEAILSRGTFMGRMPASDAWDIAKSHPLVVNFDYDELLILSKIYNQQKSTFEPATKIIDIILSSDFNSKENARSNLQTLQNQMREIVSRENQLLIYLNEGEEIFKLNSTG